MKKLLLSFILIFALFSSAFSQSIWTETSEQRLANVPKLDRASFPTTYKLYNLNLSALKSQLQNAPRDNSGENSNVVVSFPNSKGVLENFIVYDAPVMEDGLAIKFPSIKSYIAKSTDNQKTTLRFSVTEFGLHAMSLSGDLGTYYIDTYTKDLGSYIVYNKIDLQKSRLFSCLNDENNLNLDQGRFPSNVMLINDGNFRQYRLAIACTVEYSAFHLAAAGTPATATLAQKKAVVLSAMVVSMTRLNGVYEKEMSLRMNLIANNDLIIFIDSDAFTNSPTMINEIQTVVDGAIGSANYDMGHGFCTTDSGIAQLGSVCNNTGSNANGKARGITGQPSPVGDPFDIDYTAHEMGHQWGASHTQNNPCNVSAASAYEPGSASTIMGYAGICAPNVQSNSNDYFHSRSILQMTSFVLGGGTCATVTANGNTAPVVQAGVDYTIPRGTAFILKGAATDANSDPLTYCWEQYNNEITAQPPLNTYTTGPNFRSVSPSTSPNRYMPKFSDVLQGNLFPTWEVVPNVARTMNFALTVRDNRAGGGMTNRDDMVVNFASVGPFQITSPNVENTSWPVGSTQTITWDVAGTTANGINTANVNILISTDGGTSFTTLAANTPNDGSHTITAPATAAQNCRIMIEAVGNIFYAVSKNIGVGYTFTNTCTTYSNNTALPVPDGLAANTPGAVASKTISIPATQTITDVNVTLSGAHTFYWDLIVDVRHPDNTLSRLFNRNCNQVSTGFNVLFNDGSPAIVCAANLTGTFAPQQALSAFNGKPANGTWTLLATDNYNGDTGTINNWSIEICTVVASLATENYGLQDFALYPNPNNGNFNIKFNSTSSNEIKILVNDMSGRQIFNKSFSNTGLIDQNLQLENVQAGVYLVSVLDGNKKEVKKIVIE